MSRSAWSHIAIPVLSVCLLTAIWQVVSAAFFPPVLFPTPVMVARAFAGEIRSGRLIADSLVSLRRIFAGFAVGCSVGAGLGLLMGSIPLARRFLDPYIQFGRFVPSISLLSPALIWFGIGEGSKLFLITYTTTFIVLLNTLSAVLSVPRNKIRAAQSLGASRWQLFRLVVLPASLHGIFTGMRVGMGLSFTTVVAAEMIAADTGLGFLIINSRLWFQTDVVFVGIIALGALGYLADKAFQGVIHRLAWRYAPTN
ncbi:MAG TPA: ABC transporter permease [Candidatus Methylomirabilis sp.]|nr:ABC transporter permease [Candidatus Methylomirabilis sp.]